MELFGETVARRRAANARSLAAFGIGQSGPGLAAGVRTIREAGPNAIYTIGYEKRTGDDLIAALVDAGVQVLADVRDKPISRRADFRAAALAARCKSSGIEYQGWPQLGSTEAQREALRETGNIDAFSRAFRRYAQRKLRPDIAELSRVVQSRPVALLCYERVHEECHRMVLAELIADHLDVSILAIT